MTYRCDHIWTTHTQTHVTNLQSEISYDMINQSEKLNPDLQATNFYLSHETSVIYQHFHAIANYPLSNQMYLVSKLNSTSIL